VKSILALTIVFGWLALDGAPILQPIFKSSVEMVRVDALVVRDEKPVADLKADDLEVFDNGVRQTIDHVLSAEDPIDVMLTLDTSASLDKAELKHLADGVRSAIADLRPGDRAGLITFSEELSQLLPLTGRLDLLPASLDRLESSGATTLVDAAYAALLTTRARGRRSLVLLFTDGLDTWSWLEPAWVLAVAKRSETVVYTVELREPLAPFVRIPGVQGRIDPRDYYRAATRFLDDIVETTGGRRLDAGDFGRLQATLKSVLGEFRQRYVIAYAPQGVAQEGWHTLDVHVKRRGVTVRARPGYSR
jgi:Ca-activated chloride channel homolog